LRLKTSTFKPCHIICQLGSAQDNVDGVKAVFLEPSCDFSWLPTYLPSSSHQVERRFHSKNQTFNHSI
jgi:hypothetical protein